MLDHRARYTHVLGEDVDLRTLWLRLVAALYAPAPPRRKHQTGTPRVKGRKIDSPQQAAQRKSAAWKKTSVDSYGGGARRMWLLSGTVVAYNRGRAVPTRWVYVVDLEGTHRDDFLFSTDAGMFPTRLVSLFTRRWWIEVNFEEIRAHLGFEATRQRVDQSVLRMVPCLLGLFSAISFALAAHARPHPVLPASTAWYVKREITFSECLATERRVLWQQTVLGTSPYARQYTKCTAGLEELHARLPLSGSVTLNNGRIRAKSLAIVEARVDHRDLLLQETWE